MPIRVCVCDDNDGYRRMLSMCLGFDDRISIVGEAENGERAVALAEELQPDVLLLDVAMPVLDGVEALPKLRDAAPDMQIVMLSGFADSSIKQQALDAGACTYLVKGVKIDLVADAIVDCVGVSV